MILKKVTKKVKSGREKFKININDQVWSDLLPEIFSFLDLINLSNLQRVSKKFFTLIEKRTICHQPFHFTAKKVANRIVTHGFRRREQFIFEDNIAYPSLKRFNYKRIVIGNMKKLDINDDVVNVAMSNQFVECLEVLKSDVINPYLEHLDINIELSNFKLYGLMLILKKLKKKKLMTLKFGRCNTLNQDVSDTDCLNTLVNMKNIVNLHLLRIPCTILLEFTKLIIKNDRWFKTLELGLHQSLKINEFSDKFFSKVVSKRLILNGLSRTNTFTPVVLHEVCKQISQNSHIKRFAFKNYHQFPNPSDQIYKSLREVFYQMLQKFTILEFTGLQFTFANYELFFQDIIKLNSVKKNITLNLVLNFSKNYVCEKTFLSLMKYFDDENFVLKKLAFFRMVVSPSITGRANEFKGIVKDAYLPELRNMMGSKFGFSFKEFEKSEFL